MLKTTPFHARTAALCTSQAWRRWAGHVVASSYELSHEREYHAIRSSAALIDISPLYKYVVRGRDAARLLDRIVTRDVARSAAGQVLYTCWCDAAGKVLDDGTIARLDDETFRMTSADPGLRWLQDNALGLDVAIEDVSASIAALALQGPASRAILQQLTDTDLASLKYFRMSSARIRDIEVTISRTGYTGDLGYEIWMDAQDALAVMGRAGRSRFGARHDARRHARARHRAHRGRAHAARRRLRFGAQGAHRYSEVLALRARPRLDGEPRQRALRRKRRPCRGSATRAAVAVRRR